MEDEVMTEREKYLVLYTQQQVLAQIIDLMMESADSQPKDIPDMPVADTLRVFALTLGQIQFGREKTRN